MEERGDQLFQNISIHISDRSHWNLTLNVYNCGNQDMEIEHDMRPDYYIFYYVRSGRGYVTTRQVTHRVETGQGFVVFPGEETRIKSEYRGAMNVTWVAFSGYLVDRYLGRANLTVYDPVFQDDDEQTLKEKFDILLRVSTRMPNRYCKIMSELYGIFGYLLDHVAPAIPQETATPEYYLIKALDFIDTNYQEDISVEEIAASVGLNRKTLYTVFKNLTGFSPKDYLIYYRMCRATVLLQNPSLSVEAVASSVGYTDQFHFSKEFKKNVGTSPSLYRREVERDPSKAFRSPIDTVRQQYQNQGGGGNGELPPKI